MSSISYDELIDFAAGLRMRIPEARITHCALPDDVYDSIDHGRYSPTMPVLPHRELGVAWRGFKFDGIVFMPESAYKALRKWRQDYRHGEGA